MSKPADCRICDLVLGPVWALLAWLFPFNWQTPKRPRDSSLLVMSFWLPLILAVLIVVAW